MTVNTLNIENMEEGQNFNQYSFRMTNISNLKINGRLNVEWRNLEVTKIRNKNWENYKRQNWFIPKGKYVNWRNCK